MEADPDSIEQASDQMTNDWKIKELTKQEKAVAEKLRSRGIEPATPQLNVDLALSIFPIVTPNCDPDVSKICVMCHGAMLEQIKHVRIPSRLTYLHIQPIIKEHEHNESFGSYWHSDVDLGLYLHQYQIYKANVF